MLLENFSCCPFALLLGATSEPKVETSIILAEPIKIVEHIGNVEGDSYEQPDDLPHLKEIGVFVVRMRKISVPQGTFSKRTFDAHIVIGNNRNIMKIKQWVIVSNKINGKDEIIFVKPLDKFFCAPPESFKELDVDPSYPYSLTSAKGDTPKVRCYDLH